VEVTAVDRTAPPSGGADDRGHAPAVDRTAPPSAGADDAPAVERARASRPRVAGFHAAQEVGSSTSRVHPVSWGTDPLLGVVSSAAPAVVPAGLGRWASVLDAAYGYQANPDHPRGVSRRAPSAGALYPTEVFLVGAEGVHHYAFWDRRFHHGHACDAGAAARALGLGPDDLALVAVAVFWRTVQRYGIRGYRYCLLDAAHVVSNLAGVVAARGGVAGLATARPSTRLTRALALPASCGAVRALIVRGASRLGGDDRLVAPWTPRPRSLANEHSPLLSPVLQRVARFHGETLDDAAGPAPLASDPTAGAALAIRRSARSFTPAALPGEHHRAIRDFLATRRSTLPIGDDAVQSFAVRVRCAGAAPGYERIDQAGDVADLPGAATPGELAARVRALCQDQALAGEAAYAVVLGIRDEAMQHASPASYRDLVSEIGHVGAELARQAVQLGVATTTIGGFSDEAARRLFGAERWFPIAIQLYGEHGTHGYKQDAASRVLENQRA